MSRRRRGGADSNDAGQDSFLDIVANIVGILIILVMVMGVRAKHAPVTLSVPNPQQEAARRQYEQDLATQWNLHASILETEAKIKQIRQRTQAANQVRSQLALVSAAAEKIVAKDRAELGAIQREQFDQQRKLLEARDELDSLENQYDLVNRIEPKAKTIKSYSTPLSRTVNGHEIHLQLRGGRVTVIPWENVVSELKAAFQDSINRMRTRPELTSQTRPIGGFRIRYTIRQHTTSMRTYEKTGRGGTFISLDRFELIPVSDQLGVPLEQAMTRGSELSDTLGKHHPKQTTVTIWVYPDSFPEYRKLKESLYHAGFSVATWPRREGELIGGSPLGSRSAAQ